MRKALFLFGLLFVVAAGHAQLRLKKADKLFAEYAYMDAAKAYEEYLKDAKDPPAEAMARAADSYYHTGRFDDALRWYEKLYGRQGSGIDAKYLNRYIQSLRAAENHKKADMLLLERLEKQGDKKLIKSVQRQMKRLDSINEAPARYTVSNLAINTGKADFGTAFYGNQIVYSSSKDTAAGGKMYVWNQQPYLDLYVADRNAADGALINEKKFIPGQQTKYHNAALTFTPDLKRVYYSANNVKKGDKPENDKEGTNNIEILTGEVKGEQLVNAKGVPFNNKNYSTGHPALTADGKWLFFVSDMPGGYGGTDIYVAQVTGSRLGAPKNLGPKINTPGREMFPFINDSILYFSSDGHYGLGGLDVFESRLVKKLEFGEPENLGQPINSSLDDFAYIIDKEKKYGYFSSNRKGGRGDDDIYYFTSKEPEKKEEPLVVVPELETLVRQEDGVEKIDVNPIFFDLDKYDITPLAVEELDKVVHVLNTYPAVIIKIESHTDSRASDEYNITLSENRAKATYNYIISKGINPGRIESVKGYGETRLRNKCSNGVDCTDEEHQMNRRSDFIIVKK